eukprot:1598399-Rhodomonas_salina.2
MSKLAARQASWQPSRDRATSKLAAQPMSWRMAEPLDTETEQPVSMAHSAGRDRLCESVWNTQLQEQ